MDRDVTERLQAEEAQERLVSELERTARELEEQRALLEAVLEQLPTGVLVVEAENHRVLLRNEAFERIVRQPVPVGSNVITDLHWTRRHPNGRPYQVAELPPVRAKTKEEVVSGEEMVLVHPDGSATTVLVSSAPVRDAEGGLVSVVSVFQDISLRKRDEETIRYQAGLVDNVSDAILSTDERFIIRSWNKGAQRVYGWTAAEAIGRHADELLGTESSIAVLEHAAAQLLAHGLSEVEVMHRRKDGKAVHAVTTVSLLRNERGEVIGTVGIMRDVTARKRAEQERERLLVAAEEKQRLLDALLEHIPEGITIARAPDLAPLATSRHGSDLLARGQQASGLSMPAWLAQMEYYLADGVTPARPEDHPLWRAITRGHTIEGQELTLRRPDGSMLPLLCNAGPIRDSEGNITGGILAWRDISLRKHRQEALAQANQQVQWLLEALPVGIAFSRDAAGQRVVGNPACLAQFEMRPEDNISASAADPSAAGLAVRYFLEGRELSGADLPLQRAAAENREIPFVEFEVLLPSGRRWDCEAAAAPIHDLHGRVIGAVAVTVDVTERKRLEEAERARVRHARLLDTMQENVPVALAYLDAEFRFTRANTPYLRAVGRPWEELLGRIYHEAVGSPAIVELLAEARASGRRADAREDFRDGSGSAAPTYWDLSTTPVKDHGGAIVGYVLSAADVTERVAQRERLLAAERARAEIAESLHDEIAHRVKNNLAMISGLLSMQALSQSNPQTAAALRAAVTRVRTFATIHEQMYTQAAEETDLLEALRRIATTTRNVFSARHEVEIAVRGEPFICSGRDITNLCVIVNELLTNALKHGAIGPGRQAARAGGPGNPGRTRGPLRLELRPSPGRRLRHGGRRRDGASSGNRPDKPIRGSIPALRSR